MPGCSPGPSLQQMYCNQIKPSWQNHLMKNWQFCDVLTTAVHSFSSYSKLHREWTTSSQLSKPSEHVRQEGRYHADVEIRWPESRTWWKTGRFVMFFHCRTFYSTPIVNCTENGPLPVSCRSRVNMFDNCADTMRMFIAKRRTGRILISSDMRQERSFGQPPIAPAVGGI